MDNIFLQPPPQQIEPKRHVIHFNGGINPATVHNIRSATIQALLQNATSIYYVFSSEGGDVTSGIALYNFLRALPVPICMHGFSGVESIAVMIFLAADERLIVENGRFMLHSFIAHGVGPSIDPARLSERSRSIDNHMDIYAQCFEKRTQGAQTPINIREIMRNDSIIIDAPTAVSAGIATKIVPPEGLIKTNDIHWWAAP